MKHSDIEQTQQCLSPWSFIHWTAWTWGKNVNIRLVRLSRSTGSSSRCPAIVSLYNEVQINVATSKAFLHVINVVVATQVLIVSVCVWGGGGGGAHGNSAVERATPGEEVPGSIPAVAARSLLVGLVSV